MKRTLRITIIIIASIGILLLGAYLLRNVILKYSLETVITNKTAGNIKLEIERVELIPMTGEVFLIRPEISFTDFYLDEAETRKLSSVTFDSISILQLSLKELLFDRKFQASGLLVKKPQISFGEKAGTETTSFNPGYLIETIGKKPAGDHQLNINIADIEIQYGAIELRSDTTHKKISELVDFSIVLRNFNTQPTPEQKKNQIFFSDDILFKIENLKELIVSGHKLNVGSVRFSSSQKKLVINQVIFEPDFLILNKKNTLAIAANLIELNGIDLREVTGHKDIELSSLKISDGFVTVDVYTKHSLKKDTTGKETTKALVNIINTFKLDTLSIEKMDFFQILDQVDTLVAVNEIELDVLGVEIDTGMYDNIFQDIVYEKAISTSGNIQLKLKTDNLLVSADNFNYSSDIEQISLSGLKIKNDTAEYNEHELSVSLRKLEVDGVVVKPIKKPDKFHLKLDMNDLNAKIDLDHKIFKPRKPGGENWQDYAELQKIRLHNSSASIWKGSDFTIDLTGINAAVDSLKIHEVDSMGIGYSLLRIQLDEVITTLDNNNQHISSGLLIINDSLLSINDFESKLKTGNNSSKINFRRFSLPGLETKKLINNQVLTSDKLLLDGLVVSGKLDPSLFGKNNDNKSGADSAKPLPLDTINFGGVQFTNAYVNLNVVNQEKTIQLSSDLLLQTGEVLITDSSTFSSLLPHLDGFTRLTNVSVLYQNEKAELDELLVDLTDSVFSMNKLAIQSDPFGSPNENQFFINKLNLDSISISGLDYPTMLLNESIGFRKLLVVNPDLNIAIRAGDRKVQQDSVPDNSFSDVLMNTLYDTIEIVGINVQLDQRGDSSHTILSLNDLNIGHHRTSSITGNLFDEVIFNFDNFAYKDSIKKQFFKVKKGSLDIENKQFLLFEVKGGNMSKTGGESDMKSGNTYFRCPEIIFSGVYLHDGFPSVLNVDKLTLDTINFSLVTENKGTSGSGFMMKMDFLKQYTSFMTRLSIDTTQLNNITVNYQSVKDTVTNSVHIDSLGIVVNKINIDTTVLDNDVLNIAKNVTVDLKGRTHITDDSLYKIGIGMININVLDRIVTIDSFYMQPRYIDSVFFNKAVYQTDRVNLFSPRLELHGLYLDELFDENHIHLGNIDLHEVDLEMYRDKRYPMKPDIYKKMPQAILRDLKQKFTIDSVRILNSTLRYGEYTEKSEKAGDVYFDRFNIRVFNITSDLSDISRDASLKLNLDAYVESEAKIWASLIFPLNKDEDEFWLTGGSETLDLTKLNRLTENVLGIAITNGKGWVDIPLVSGNNVKSGGTLTFRYKKLKIAIYDREKNQMGKGFGSGFMNFMINDLLLKSNNPRFARKVRKGLVYFERDTEKAMTNYVWKSILSGMLSTMGFNNKEQRQEKRELKKN